MDEEHGGHTIMLVMIATNCVLSVFFLLVAAYANHCLLAREDRRQVEDEHGGRLFPGDQTIRENCTALKSRLYDVVATTTSATSAGVLNTPELSASNWSFSFCSDPPANANADFLPLLGSIREQSPDASLLQSNTPASTAGTITGNRSIETIPSLSSRRDWRTNWSIFRDPKSLLFMLAVCCSLGQAGTALILTLTNPEHLLSGGNRRNQDLIASPQAFLFLLYFTVLCILLHKLGDTARRFSTKLFRITVCASVVSLVALMAAAVALVLMGVFPVALEVLCTVYQGILALSFLITAVVLPQRIVRYGESLAPIASKIRRVTLTTAFSLLVRLTILLPVVQNGLSVVGVFAPSIFFVFSIIPVAASLHLLHSPR